MGNLVVRSTLEDSNGLLDALFVIMDKSSGVDIEKDLFEVCLGTEDTPTQLTVVVCVLDRLIETERCSDDRCHGANCFAKIVSLLEMIVVKTTPITVFLLLDELLHLPGFF